MSNYRTSCKNYRHAGKRTDFVQVIEISFSRRIVTMAVAVAEESSAIGDKIASATERRRQITILVERAVEYFRRSGRTGAAFVAAADKF
jgi:hypothetical protein